MNIRFLIVLSISFIHTRGSNLCTDSASCVGTRLFKVQEQDGAGGSRRTRPGTAAVILAERRRLGRGERHLSQLWDAVVLFLRALQVRAVGVRRRHDVLALGCDIRRETRTCATRGDEGSRSACAQILLLNGLCC